MSACDICVIAEFVGSSVYEPASASYSVFIIAPFNGIAELKEQIPSTGDYDFTLSLTDAVVTCVSGSRIFIQDSGAGILLYGTEADLDEKDVLNGIVTGTAKVYQGQYEITDIDLTAVSKSSQATVPCDEYSVADVLDLGMDIESMRIKITYASVTAINSKNITVTQDGSSIICYDQNSVATSVAVGDLINVTGYYKKHNGTTDEIVFYAASDIETVTAPSITLSNVPSAAVDVEGDVLSVGYAIANGISGKSVSASADVAWINTFDYGNDEIEFVVDSNDEGYSASRTGTVTVSYPYAADQTFQVTQSGNSFAITYAAVAGGTLSGPARAKANETVNLTATPASNNYTFDNNWSVTPAIPGISVTITNDTFTMPASDVTVSGSFTNNGGGGNPQTYTYTFTSKSWTATLDGNQANWTSGKDGAGFSNNGIQVTTAASGANGTSPVSFANVTKIVCTYNTNTSKGAGSIVATIGSNTATTNSVGYSGSANGTTALFTTEFNYSTPQSGALNLKVNTTTNSIYLVSVAITAE